MEQVPDLGPHGIPVLQGRAAMKNAKLYIYIYIYLFIYFKQYIYKHIIISKSYFLQLFLYLLLAMGWKKLIIPPPHPVCAPCFGGAHCSHSSMPVHASSDSSDGASKSSPHWKPTLID